MLQLYGYWRSTAAYRVRIALAYKNLPFENKSIHLVKDGGQQNGGEFSALNPQRLVPVLVDGDLQLNQSMAILEYLEEQYPTPGLMPTDTNRKAKVRAFCQEIVADIHPLNNLRVLQYLVKSMNVNDDQKLLWYRHWIQKGFESLEQKVETGGEFCFGELSLADLCLIPQMYNAKRFDCSLEAFPKLRAIEERCLGLASFKAAEPEAQPDAN